MNDEIKFMDNKIVKFFEKNKINSGFTLLEVALTLIVLGVILAPAIMLYHQHKIAEDWEKTEYNIDTVQTKIGGFRSIYGRYPCPAPLTAQPGEIEYGHEDCTIHALGSCVDGTCTSKNAISGKTILEGTLPFKILDLDESQAYDKYGNRLIYAVTADLTTSSTYTIGGGGISVDSYNDSGSVSAVNPPGSAHFVW